LTSVSCPGSWISSAWYLLPCLQNFISLISFLMSNYR
jgi:hypothetical protein